MAERCVNKLYLNKERIQIKLTAGSVETLIRLVKPRNVTKYFKKGIRATSLIAMIIKNFPPQRRQRLSDVG
ncbi:conserved hypothetical protein [Enterobacterales bacterium 8AC]|nr:conserved hypothetical protein [Enterobacterales bacterium 8AC]